MNKKNNFENIDIFDKKEPLFVELERYMEEDYKYGYKMLRHPLVYCIPYLENFNYFINRQYEQKLNALKTYKENKNWEQYIFMYEKPYRIQMFNLIKKQLSDKDYWKILGEIWINSENIWQNKNIWKTCFSSKRKNKQCLMIESELDDFNKLDNEINIYRGCQNKNKDGFSWTLDYNKAKWFSNRFEKFGNILSGQCNKKDIIAYFSRRNEEEIVVLPKHVRIFND